MCRSEAGWPVLAWVFAVSLFFASAAVFPKALGSPAEEWLDLFDGKSLSGWVLTNFGGEGSVKVEGGSIVMDFGNDLTGITWKGEVPIIDYELQVDARRLEGSDFFCGLTFPVNDSHCSLIVGGWGGTVVGLSSVDGRDASENPTSRLMSFEQGRWYHLRIRVGRQRIEVWIDGERVVTQDIEGRKIGIRPEVDLSRPMGIASWRTRAALRGIRLRRLNRE